MKVKKVKGGLLRQVQAACDGEVCLGLFKGRKLVGFIAYDPATVFEPFIFVSGVVVRKDSRKEGSRLLLTAMARVIRNTQAVIKKKAGKFFLMCETQSTAGERLVKLAERRFGFTVVDWGWVSRTAEGGKQSGAWEEFV